MGLTLLDPEWLGLGLEMPARSQVLAKLSRWPRHATYLTTPSHILQRSSLSACLQYLIKLKDRITPHVNFFQ